MKINKYIAVVYMQTKHMMKVIKNAINSQVKRETDRVKTVERAKCKKAKAKQRKKK